MTTATHRPADAPPRAAAAPTPRVRVALEYSVTGDLRFISHRDEMRVLGRALARAAWPLAYSRGFNPAPHLAIALPRSTGMASLCQVALIDLVAPPAEPDELAERLIATLPPAMHFTRMWANDVPRSLHPRRVTYECALPADQAALLRAGLREARSPSAPLLVERTGANGKTTTVDARPLVEAIELTGDTATFIFRFDGERSARPIDILKVLGLDPLECGHRTQRVAVEWTETLAGCEIRPVNAERATSSPAAHDTVPACEPAGADSTTPG